MHVLRDVQDAAGRQVPDQHLHHDELRVTGAEELVEHAEQHLGIKAGGTTPDGLFTLERAECQAACTEAPCLQANYRYRYRVTAPQLDQFLDDLAEGRLDAEIPSHGVVARVRQSIPVDRAVGSVAPDDVHEAPVWMRS